MRNRTRVDDEDSTVKIVEQSDERLKLRCIPWYSWITGVFAWWVIATVALVILHVQTGVEVTADTTALAVVAVGAITIAGILWWCRVHWLVVDRSEGEVRITDRGLLAGATESFELDNVYKIDRHLRASGGTGASLTTYSVEFYLENRDEPIRFGQGTSFVGDKRSKRITKRLNRLLHRFHR